WTETTRPNFWVGRWRSRSRIAPSGEMIMKSRMIVNCRKASMPTTNFWYEEKAGGGPAWAPGPAVGGVAGAGRTGGGSEEKAAVSLLIVLAGGRSTAAGSGRPTSTAGGLRLRLLVSMRRFIVRRPSGNTPEMRP